jgi:hypothetical protein
MNQTPWRSETAELDGPTWAQARLRLGQTNVGFWVIVAAVLWWNAPPWWGSWAGWSAVILGYLMAQLPFDVVGGHLLPRQYGRSDASWAAWFAEWGRGAVLHGGFLVLAGWLVMTVASATSSWAAVGVLWSLGGLLVATQAWWIRRMVPLRAPGVREAALLRDSGLEPEEVSLSDARDRSFVGGWVGPRGMERLVVPSSWFEALDGPSRGAVLRRRRLALQSGARAQGVLGAHLFQALGLVVLLLLRPELDLTAPAGLLQLSAGSTLWAFLGVLTLPTLSRRAVYALDRITSEEGGAEPLAKVIETLDVDQEDEPRRVRLIETIFHPVPASQHRVAALRWTYAHGRVGFAPWRIARMSLWMSWASLSWLSRAVHCNVGRAELWVAYPGD